MNLVLIVILCVPGFLLSQTMRYASPTGSSSAAGTRIAPWDITRTLSALGTDTSVTLLDGIFTQGNSTTWTIGTGTGTNRSRLIADTALHVAFVRANGTPASISVQPRTTVQGIMFGGTLEPSTTGYGSRTLRSGDSLTWCVFWGNFDDGVGCSSYPVVVRDCLFGPMGYRIYDHTTHAIYYTGFGTVDSQMYATRNVFAGKETADSICGGYALHNYHGPSYINECKNFVRQWGSCWIFDGDHALLRDNVFFSNQAAGIYKFDDGQTINHEFGSTWPSAQNTRYAHNFHGKIGYPQAWVPTAGNTADSNYYTDSPAWYPNSLFNPDIPGTGQRYRFTLDVTTLLGKDSSQVDSIANLLATAMYNKSAANVLADASIRTNWQSLLNVVDKWQGTTEEAVPSSSGADVPNGTFSANPSSLPYGGGSSTLSWTSSNATSASIDQGIGSVGISGEITPGPITTTTTYTLTLTGSGGTTQYQTTVTVAASPPVDASKRLPWRKP